MSRYGSLLQRLNAGGAQAHSQSHKADLTSSVAEHLAKMLSTRAGSVQTLPDYGLPDLNDMRLSLYDVLRQSRQAIERFIEQYEPRLSKVQVTASPHDQNQLSLSFRIDGLLAVEGDKCPVQFAASLDGRGQVTLS